MKIGLYNTEPKIVNTAMMQVSQYHKQKGDIVEQYNPIFHEEYDEVYAFSIFSFTPKHYIRPDMIVGGTGFDIKSRLSPEQEACNYDWSLYPDCDHSILWFSRGCVRNCPFCIVQQKEGMICPVKPKNLNPNGKFIKVQDNNFFASPKWREAIQYLKDTEQPADFEGGVDARTLNEERCKALLSLKHHKQIKIAWDNPKDDLEPKLKEILKTIKPYRLMCYVLIGYWSSEAEDIHRVETLRKLKIDPFVMPYNKHDDYQSDYARYVNFKAIFKSTKWEDYKRRVVT